MTRYKRQHLDLLRELIVSQLKMKNQSSLFGFAWSFLNPLIMLLVIFTVFSFRIGQNVDHYAVYLLIGLVQYTNLSNSTTAAMHSLDTMSQVAKEAIFPKELLVVSTVLARVVEFIVSFVVALVIAGASGVSITPAVLLLPFVILLQVVVVLWISLFLAWLYPVILDIDHIYQVVLRVLFFITPIFYTLDFLQHNELAMTIVTLNPLTHLISFSRTLILEGEVFPIPAFLLYLLVNCVFLVISYRVFKRRESTSLEML